LRLIDDLKRDEYIKFDENEKMEMGFWYDKIEDLELYI
jgi:hypothetical protein